MFLLNEFKKPTEAVNNKNSTIYKDSLEVSNSIIKPNSNIITTGNKIDEEEAWKNEMMIYEKYLKDDLDTYGKQLQEYDTSNSVSLKRFSNKSSIQESQNLNSDHSAKDKRMNNFNKNLTHISNDDSKEKIEKLKTSVDHLRKEFHTDIQKIDARYSVDKKNNDSVLHEIKRKVAARKIQRWFRRHNLRIKAGEAALKR